MKQALLTQQITFKALLNQPTHASELSVTRPGFLAK